jgi:hypothetical protein
VQHERIRLRSDQPPGLNATTEIGRELQRRLGAATPVADQYVEQFAKCPFESGVGKKGQAQLTARDPKGKLGDWPKALPLSTAVLSESK